MTTRTIAQGVVGISANTELYVPRESRPDRPINMAANIQLNVRIPRYLKEQGEEVLTLCHTNSSDVVRLLWNYMVKHQEIPACLLQEESPDEERMRRIKAVEEGRGFYVRACEQLGLTKESCENESKISYKEMRDQMYEEMLDKYLAL